MLDAGPLVSFLGSGLRHHAWAVEQWKRLRPPLLTCEPVLAEAAFLLKRERREADALFALLERGVVRVALSVQEEHPDLRALMRRYRNRPMSLADACLVRLSEIHPTGQVFTLDSDFRIYRRHGNKVRHPPQSGWLDELDRLKGGWAKGLGVARCAPYWLLQNCP
ncbi:MAG: PIN domain-containing protein, partial [Acidobacteria bacterium]|nr:PIN domain-containing protein [Acidobacteriota bacterium]